MDALSGPSLMLVAVEPSADEIGAELMEALRAAEPNVRFIGCGGAAMERRGLVSAFPISQFSVIGVGDVLRAAPAAFARARALARLAAERRVDAVIFIDGWAFSRLGAKALRRLAPDILSIKLVAPQIWASRPERIGFVRAHFDGVLALLPFEPPLFERAGIRAAFIGNPLFQRARAARGDGDRFRARHLLGEAATLGILLGSRTREVTRLAPVFRATAQALAAATPDLRIISPVADSVAALSREALKDFPGAPVIVGADEKYDAMAAMTAALTASGTASTELAINGAPLVVAYRVDWLTALWFRRLMITPYVSIINVAAGREIIPEFIQERAEPVGIAAALAPLLSDETARAAQKAATAEALARLGVSAPPAARVAADFILAWIGERRRPAIAPAS